LFLAPELADPLMFKVVPLDPGSDADAALEALLNRVYVEGGFTEPAFAQSLFRSENVRARGTVLAAIDNDDGRLIGLVVAVQGGTSASRFAVVGESELHLLCVDPSARGRGVGRALVDRAIEVARTMGSSRMILWTQPSMAAARHLYEQCGFVRAADRDFSRGERAFQVFSRPLDA
jgi:GNAT superfamily N-acetyltransferase